MGIIDLFKNIFSKTASLSEYQLRLFYESLPEKKYPKYLKEVYKKRIGRKLNLRNPKRISEKIQWLKLYDNLPIKTTLSDKIAVRDWVKSKVDINFPELYGAWNSFDEIDFDSLPKSFALKANHGSRMNIFIADKDILLKNGREKIKKVFDCWLNTNFAFCYGFELQYKDIVPKVFAEELLLVEEGKSIIDYEIWCFNGKPTYVEYSVLIENAKPQIAFYDRNWQKQPFGHTHKVYEGGIPKPEHLDEMFRMAEVLSKGFKLVRVDFYDLKGKIYFAEMTFTPFSGHMKFTPDKYDRILGDMLDLKK